MTELHFPVSAVPLATLGIRALARGISLRRAADSDLPWMRELYASTRADELSSVPWPDAAKLAFVDSQFSLQHRHFVSQIDHLDFWVIEQNERPIGRYYVSRNDPVCIVDVSLLPQARSQGVGTALISDTLDQARQLGFGVMLHVLHSNFRAAKLYRQLGFVITDDSGTHAEMRWTARVG